MPATVRRVVVPFSMSARSSTVPPRYPPVPTMTRMSPGSSGCSYTQLISTWRASPQRGSTACVPRTAIDDTPEPVALES